MAEVEIPNPEELHERGGQTFSRRVALTTAIYAIVLSIAALGGNNSVKEMLFAQQQASDQWAFYQAKVIRLVLAVLGAVLTMNGFARFFTLPRLHHH